MDNDKLIKKVFDTIMQKKIKSVLQCGLVDYGSVELDHITSDIINELRELME